MTKIQFSALLFVLFLSLYLMPSFLRSYSAVLGRQLFSIMASEYRPGSLSMAFVTVPNEEVANKLASELVKKKLAACVNIIPGVKSIYEWEGKIENDSELILMIKTRSSHIDEISSFMRENHPNEVAEVISSPIENGNPPYLKWVAEVIPEKSDSS